MVLHIIWWAFVLSSFACGNIQLLLIIFAGGNSFACPDNAGGAGTLYDAVPRTLTVSNYNMSTDTETLLLEFPNQPLWTNVYVQNCARATVPLLWSRVQVCGTGLLLCQLKFSILLCFFIGFLSLYLSVILLVGMGERLVLALAANPLF